MKTATVPPKGWRVIPFMLAYLSLGAWIVFACLLFAAGAGCLRCLRASVAELRRGAHLAVETGKEILR